MIRIFMNFAVIIFDYEDLLFCESVSFTFSPRQIKRANMEDGSDTEKIMEDQNSAWGITLDVVARKMYWSQPSTRCSISRGIML